MFCTAAMVTLVVTETVAQGDAFVVTRRLSWGHALLQQTESTCNTIVPGVYRTKMQVINQEWYWNLFRGTVGKDPFTLRVCVCACDCQCICDKWISMVYSHFVMATNKRNSCRYKLWRSVWKTLILVQYFQMSRSPTHSKNLGCYWISCFYTCLEIYLLQGFAKRISCNNVDTFHSWK